MKYLLIILIALLFSACLHISPFRQTKKNEIIESKYVSYQAPHINWEITKRYGNSNWKHYGKTTDIMKNVNGSNLELRAYTYPFNWMPIDILFDKDGDYEARRRFGDNSPRTIARHKEQGIEYSKGWVPYMNGLKCVGGVFSRGHGIYSKNYSITCGYYDTTETKNDSKRILIIDYDYNYASTYYNRLQKDKGVPQSELLTPKQVELELKEAVKKVISTLKIKHIDIPRMQKEGLMHYDKKFKSTKW